MVLGDGRCRVPELSSGKNQVEEQLSGNRFLEPDSGCSGNQPGPEPDFLGAGSVCSRFCEPRYDLAVRGYYLSLFECHFFPLMFDVSLVLMVLCIWCEEGTGEFALHQD